MASWMHNRLLMQFKSYWSLFSNNGLLPEFSLGRFSKCHLFPTKVALKSRQAKLKLYSVFMTLRPKFVPQSMICCNVLIGKRLTCWSLKKGLRLAKQAHQRVSAAKGGSGDRGPSPVCCDRHLVGPLQVTFRLGM